MTKAKGLRKKPGPWLKKYIIIRSFSAPASV
jgi:hypothetical protein